MKTTEALELNYKLQAHIAKMCFESIVGNNNTNPKWKDYEIGEDYLIDMIDGVVEGITDYDLIKELYHKYRHQFVSLSEGIKFMAELVESDYAYITENSHRYHNEAYVEGCIECDAEYAKQADEYNSNVQEYYRSAQ